MILGFFGCLFLFCWLLFVTMYWQIKHDDDDDDDDLLQKLTTVASFNDRMKVGG